MMTADALGYSSNAVFSQGKYFCRLSAVTNDCTKATGIIQVNIKMTVMTLHKEKKRETRHE